jgi:hypothetical protein
MVWIICFWHVSNAQIASLQVDGYMKLKPIKVTDSGLEGRIILYDGAEGVFRGYNGSKWVDLSTNAHMDLSNCPNRITDDKVPEPRCLTSMSGALGQVDETTIFTEDFDLATKDNCGYYTISFAQDEIMPILNLTWDNRGTQLRTLYFKDMVGNLNFCEILASIEL